MPPPSYISFDVARSSKQKLARPPNDDDDPSLTPSPPLLSSLFDMFLKLRESQLNYSNAAAPVCCVAIAETSDNRSPSIMIPICSPTVVPPECLSPSQCPPAALYSVCVQSFSMIYYLPIRCIYPPSWPPNSHIREQDAFRSRDIKNKL